MDQYSSGIQMMSTAHFSLNTTFVNSQIKMTRHSQGHDQGKHVEILERRKRTKRSVEETGGRELVKASPYDDNIWGIDVKSGAKEWEKQESNGVL
ncbi:hypothetical protein NHQ30_002826 [Ciborinia camelliae]|nr:hypothetical protein NHQ30_002826 [Ciborinia camelliae]